MATIIDPPSSVWPNGLKVDSEGYVTFYPLGTNKVDISTITWPDGDKLISPFVYQNDKLVGFVDTKALTVSGSATTTMNYSHIEADFASIFEGKLTVNAPNAIVKKFKWSVVESNDNIIVTLKYKGCKTVSDIEAVDPDYKTNDIVDGIWVESLSDLEIGCYEKGSGFFAEKIGMFTDCTNLTTFSPDLPSLTDGTKMFYKCSKLTSFSSDLSRLTDGTRMFEGCSNLASFNADLSNLTSGQNMFNWCYNLTSFNSDLSSLTDASGMFYYCNNLTSFNFDLTSLTNGYYMFNRCIKLTSFSSDLSSLTNGNYMFDSCKLDAPSVKNIIDTINTYSGKLTIGMGCDDTETDKNLFAQEVDYADMTSLLTALSDKGWTVTAQYNGRPASTYSLRRPAENTFPVFAKLEETEEYADYASEDGSKKYMLSWFHETTGSTDGYTQFNSLEEAVAHFNIKPIERN